MSIQDNAKIEMEAAGITGNDARTMSTILATFFQQWDSGGAVSVVAPVLQRLITGKPLTPLTGEDNEWHDPMGGGEILQNIRCSTVFKYPRKGNKVIDVDTGKMVTFPYSPEKAEIADPVVQFTITAKGDPGT